MYTILTKNSTPSVPMTRVQLRGLVETGVVTRETPVTLTASGRTLRAASLPELADLLLGSTVVTTGPLLKSPVRQKPLSILPAPDASSVSPTGTRRITELPVLRATSGAPDPVANTPTDPNVLFLREATRQYRSLNGWQLFGAYAVLGLGAYLFGLLGIVAGGLVSLFGVAMLVYALTQKPALRSRVTDRGVDASEWARPLERHFWLLSARSVVAIMLSCTVLAGLLQWQIASVTGRDGRLDLARANSTIVMLVAQSCRDSDQLFARVGQPQSQNRGTGHYELEYACADNRTVYVELKPYGRVGDVHR